MVTSWEAIQQIIDTNLSATIALCKMFCRLNLPRSRLPSGKPSNFSEVPLRNLDETSREDSVAANPGSLCIINISSLLGIKGGFGATAYAASKAGVLGFTRALVCEHGKEAINNVRVNALVPGYINTPMTQGKYIHHQAGVPYAFCFFSSPIFCFLNRFFQPLSTSFLLGDFQWT